MASRGVNKAIIIGNLGKDPEVRYMPSGGAVTTVTVATTETWKDKTSGENQERTEWHRIVMFNRLAEIAGEYLKKGARVYFEGQIRTRKYQDKAGVERYTTEIVASDMQFLDRAPGGGSMPNLDTTNFSNKTSASNTSSPEPALVGADDFDDDVPF